MSNTINSEKEFLRTIKPLPGAQERLRLYINSKSSIQKWLWALLSESNELHGYLRAEWISDDRGWTKELVVNQQSSHEHNEFYSTINKTGFMIFGKGRFDDYRILCRKCNFECVVLEGIPLTGDYDILLDAEHNEIVVERKESGESTKI
ncbi:MAG: hypothetical protein PXY39_02960 [archaeon]|nr:hypothetical protein [archaeon]